VPKVTSDDVERVVRRVVRREFPLDALVDVVMPLFLALDACGAKKAWSGGRRVQLGALQLARGSAERLYPLIEDGRRDFRDVVDWANITQPPQDSTSGSRDAAT
jgi:hypothetical protein